MKKIVVKALQKLCEQKSWKNVVKIKNKKVEFKNIPLD